MLSNKFRTILIFYITLHGLPLPHMHGISPASADIYRFTTVDGIETFTDTPTQKDAQLIMKAPDRQKHTKKQNARTLSRETTRPSTPSLHEIIEKTIQAQATAGSNADTVVETLLPVNGTITSGVGMRIDPIDGVWRHHNGIDIAVPLGTPVHAVADGTVVFAGSRSGYGLTVLVEHTNGMVTLCGHNSRLVVEAGQHVSKGATIALAGSTGRSTGPHVHFEAWQSGNNITMAFMPGSTTRIAAIARTAPHKTFIRKEVLADGSLLITNIPASIP